MCKQLDNYAQEPTGRSHCQRGMASLGDRSSQRVVRRRPRSLRCHCRCVPWWMPGSWRWPLPQVRSSASQGCPWQQQRATACPQLAGTPTWAWASPPPRSPWPLTRQQTWELSWPVSLVAAPVARSQTAQGLGMPQLWVWAWAQQASEQGCHREAAHAHASADDARATS